MIVAVRHGGGFTNERLLGSVARNVLSTPLATFSWHPERRDENRELPGRTGHGRLVASLTSLSFSGYSCGIRSRVAFRSPAWLAASSSTPK